MQSLRQRSPVQSRCCSDRECSVLLELRNRVLPGLEKSKFAGKTFRETISRTLNRGGGILRTPENLFIPVIALRGRRQLH